MPNGTIQDYELLLRVRADLLQAIQGMASLGKSIGGVQAATEAVGEISEATATRIQKVVEAVARQEKIQESARSQAERAAEAAGTTARAYDAEAAAIQRVQRAETARSAAPNRTEQAAQAAALDAQRVAMAKLAGQIDPTVAALEKLDVQERRLQTLFKAGAIAKDDFVALQAVIDGNRAALTGAGKAMHTFNLNTASARVELGRMIKDIATGNFGRLEQSAATLAAQTGFLSLIFSPLGLVIGTATAALGSFVVAAIEVGNEEAKVNQAIQQTGNIAGVTTGQLAQMASGITAANGKLGDTRSILTTLVASGKVGGTALRAMGQAAVDMAALTGESADDATKAVLQLFDGTAAGALKANDPYHFLTTAIYDQIVALEEEGKTQEAMDVAAEAFHAAAVQRIADTTDKLYGLARVWESVKTAASGAWEAIRTTSSLTLGTADDQTRIYELLGRKQTAQEGHWGGIVQGIMGRGFGKAEQAELEALQQRVADETQKAQTDSLSQQLSTAAVKADADLNQLSASVDRLAERDRKLKQLDKDFEGLFGGGDGDNAKLQGVLRIVGDDGGVSYAGGLYDRLRADIEKRYAPHTPKGRSTAAQEKAAESAQADLVKALGDEQGVLDPVARAWATYNDQVAKANALAAKAKTGKGADVAAIDAQRNALVQMYASARDASLAKEAAKDREAFEKLRDSLKDINGVSLGKVRTQISQLNAELAKGTISPEEYRSTVEDALNQGIKKLPDYQGVDATVGGPFGELDKLHAQQAQLEQAYQADLDLLNQQHDAKLRSDESFFAKEAELSQAHVDRLNAIEQDRTKVTLMGLTSMFAGAADTVKEGFGEQSRAYRAAFALSKAAAVAQATVNMYLDISQASAKGWPANIPLIAKAIAEGVSILGSINAVSAGFATGGYTGDGRVDAPAGIVHGREFVSRAGVVAQPGARDFLTDFNQRGMRALAEWSMPGYATGGYVMPLDGAARSTAGFTAPVDPAPRSMPTSAGGTAADRSIGLRIINVVDPALVSDFLDSGEGETIVMNHVGRNKQKLKQWVKG